MAESKRLELLWRFPPNGFQDRPVMTTSVTLRIGVGEGVRFPNATLEEWSVANYTTPTYHAFRSNG